MLDVTQISDVIDIKSENYFVRPIYAGNAISHVETDQNINLLTIRPTSFDKCEETGGNASVEDVEFVDSEIEKRQKTIAEEVLKRIDSSKLWDAPIVTSIEPINNYSTAEDYHQNYYNNNASTNGYCNMVIRPKVTKFKIKYADLIE